MAIDLTLKSTSITNREATPRVLSSANSLGDGVVRCVSGYIASVTASLTTTSIIRLCEVPSNAKVLMVKIFSEAQTAGAFDVGIYRNNTDGGANVSKTLFGSAVSCAAAVLGTDITQEAGSPATYTIAKMHQPLWQAAGASVDPKSTYDVAATVTTTDVTTGTGALGVQVWYTL